MILAPDLFLASPSAIVDGLASAFPVLDEFARMLRQGVPSLDIERETDRQVCHARRCVDAWAIIYKYLQRSQLSVQLPLATRCDAR